MALYKPMELPNGIVLNYHRITDLFIFTNQYIDIHISSYVSQQKREEERKATEENSPMDVYIEGYCVQTDYREDGMSIEQAYEYLKTLPEFEGSEDV